MIIVSVLYPKTDSSHFDIDYYCNRHMPMVKERLGPALKRMAVEQGIAGGTPGSKPPYAAIGHLYFDSVDAFQASFGPHVKEIMGDIPNYTNVQPAVQIGEVKI